MKSHDLLIEIGTEELPSAAVKSLSEALANQLIDQLTKANIHYGQVRVFATPRRLAVLLHEVAAQQPNQTISRRGPAVNLPQDTGTQPSAALLGFAKSCGAKIKDLKRQRSEKGEWWVYESNQIGRPTAELLLPLIQDVVKNLPIAKPMRWGSGGEEFTRPVHWVVVLYGDVVIPGELLGVTIGHTSYGHRFHHPEAIPIPVPCLYESLLTDAKVVADFNRRRQEIRQQVEKIAHDQHLQAVMPDELLDEVTSIVEWPKALLVSFDPRFLSVPAEALIAAMQSHQKCFALCDKAGQLTPYFITVSNIDSQSPEQVVLGNEKVMRARLSDAAFFYQQDQKKPLSDCIEATKKVVFQASLGSLADKTLRMAILMEMFVHRFDLDAAEANRAVQLSKCDLLTGMVGEFPELQGLMGYYYARHDQESMAVALSLHEQYMPKFATDQLPSSLLGTALSLVDRLDTLVGLFAIGQKPSGVKDPFKLRRHALAIVRMLMQNAEPMNLSTLLKATCDMFVEKVKPINTETLVAELKTFILDRLQSYYQGQGIAPEFVYAVRARQDEWLYDLDKRIKALLEFMTLPEAFALSAACKRVGNLLSHAENLSKSQKVQVNLFIEPAEKALYEQIIAIETGVEPEYLAGNYSHILSQLASLKAPIDVFFEEVMVLIENEAVKQNRLSLLTRLQVLLQGVADISQLSNVLTTTPSTQKQTPKLTILRQVRQI